LGMGAGALARSQETVADSIQHAGQHRLGRCLRAACMVENGLRFPISPSSHDIFNGT